MRIDIGKNYSDCCGCGVCALKCPKQAISMIRDSDGFIYPSINDQLCINCGICNKVCTYRKKDMIPVSDGKVYIAQAVDIDISNSSSGGAFGSIGRKFILSGGYVYGSKMSYENGELKVYHTGVSSLEELKKLYGSKYVQSDLNKSFMEIENRLIEKQLVLFCGTPCQVAALYGFLQKDYDTLYTIDLVCHGVPNIQFFHDYIQYIEKQNNYKIIDFRFRDKSEGWKLKGRMTVETENGIKNIEFDPEESSYYQMFLNSYTYRENCYTCQYASKHRPGNLTLGDYWNIDLVHPEVLSQNGGDFIENKGISCIVINNAKGEELIRRFGEGLMLSSSTYNQASKYNHQLVEPAKLNEERAIVLEKNREDYSEVERWYQRRLNLVHFKRKIRENIPTWIKKLYRKARNH